MEKPDTSFTACLEAERRWLPLDRPLATVTIEMAELRRLLLHFFSCGVVHQVAMRRQLDELLPAGDDQEEEEGWVPWS